MSLQLALHELIGHGCGELLQETKWGTFNCDKNNMPINPLIGEAVSTWYGIGETPESVFGVAYIECLAEGIGLYLMSADGVLDTVMPDAEVMVDEPGGTDFLRIGCSGVQCVPGYRLGCLGVRGLLSYDTESNVRHRTTPSRHQAKFC